uniref:Osmoprotectant transport system permease protein n=1 Tax=Candidatus Kentrum sp. DK TaxID=2126562 RepID=A0A450SMJ9_9GAMM|nr:MAG: osmoprotectant transport system permease protein [Candidatus Kentron sp. DK]
MKKIRQLLACLLVLYAGPSVSADATVRVASKLHTEGVILAEMMVHLLENAGVETVHLRELGGSHVIWKALTKGEVDLYVEYTGTIAKELFPGDGIETIGDIRRRLGRENILATDPLGFNSTYAISMKPAVAARRGIRNISDLRGHPDLRFGFTERFLARKDGWEGLRRAYGLPQTDVRGLHHYLAYRGLDNGDVDLMDGYSNDGEIAYYGLRVLADDRHYFPDYHPLILYRADLITRVPHALSALQRLVDNISEEEMRRMNGAATLDKIPEARIAADFLEEKFSIRIDASEETLFDRLYRFTIEHLILVGISLSAAIALSIPLGIMAFRHESLGQIVLGIAGIIQTIPSLALLVFLIPLLGVGDVPAIVALFLYSLLPIIRNTYVGLAQIPLPLKESAEALGLSPMARLRLIELPLASRAILAGIKTSAILNIGAATLGALIGAGGYGQPILTGIRLDDMGLILQGAIPAAVLALLAQGLFELAERSVVPRGLRAGSE